MAKRLLLPGLTALTALALSSPLHAAPVRVLSSDERGVTLRLDVPAWRLADAAAGQKRVVVPGFEATDVPGRAAMPFASVLVALPPGSRASARVQQEEWSDAGTVRLETAGRPGFEGADRRDLQPIRTPVDAITDGPWPRGSVEAGEPFSLRRQRMVAVLLRPFRWDAASGRLSVTRS